MKSDAFNQNASPGFIEIYSLQMRTAQDLKLFALFTIGGDSNKRKYAPLAKKLVNLGFTIYATIGTHKYFKSKGIASILLHKMWEKKNPNLEDLFRVDWFDVVFHVKERKPSADAKVDEQVIREWTVKNNRPYITDLTVAKNFVHKLEKRMVVRSGSNE